jgi:hypothetical protein
VFWIVQKNLHKEGAFQELVDALERQDAQYQVVDIVPFSHEMIPDVTPPAGEPVFVCGATSMGDICKAKGWTPGYFDENLDYVELCNRYKYELMNHDMAIGKLRSVHGPWKRFFLRPVSDKKQFAGQVMNLDEFEDWREKIVAFDGESSHTTITGDDMVIMSSLKAIYAEYRFFVVDGVVVTGSQYKNGSRVHYSSNVDQEVYEYAQKIVDIWAPNRAFALDIFDTPEGLKVGEINSINSAGFYALDMVKFVDAINSMKF